MNESTKIGQTFLQGAGQAGRAVQCSLIQSIICLKSIRKDKDAGSFHTSGSLQHGKVFL